MILTEGEPAGSPWPEREANRTLIEAILRGDEPTGIRLSRLNRNLPVQWAKQRQHWCSEV